MDSKFAGKWEDLGNCIERKSVECLNNNSKTPAENVIFERGGGQSLMSEKGDPQMLVTFNFNAALKVHHVSIKGGSEKGTWPKIVKIYVNAGPMDFSSAESTDPEQVIEIKEKDFNNMIELRYVKFQSVTSLAIFFEENHGADTTVVSELIFYGLSGQVTNMQQFGQHDEDQ